MKCPDCGEDLKTSIKLGQGVWKCPECNVSWFILKIVPPTWKRKKYESS